MASDSRRRGAPCRAQPQVSSMACRVRRLAAVYNQIAGGRIVQMGDEPKLDDKGYLIYSATFHYQGPRRFYSGGAGLVSSITDYARFLQMLPNGDELDGVRVLSRKSVELMTVNHVGDLFGVQGFGLGFSVVRDLGKGSELSSVWAYGWGGVFYTNFIVDPKEQMIVIFMAQLYPANDVRLHERFRALVYQAIVDGGRSPEGDDPASLGDEAKDDAVALRLGARGGGEDVFDERKAEHLAGEPLEIGRAEARLVVLDDGL